ncbi:MAG: hypothetical protein IPK03_00230 [Bacteroidetes bacterium]|nr:hypothetical protein [Bacteroidota bacterium]
MTKKNYDSGGSFGHFSLEAQLELGSALKIKITSLSSDTSQTAKGIWSYDMSSNVNWTISEFDFNAYFQTFTAKESGKNCDLKILFMSGSYLIEYFEMNSVTATRNKTIIVK